MNNTASEVRECVRCNRDATTYDEDGSPACSDHGMASPEQGHMLIHWYEGAIHGAILSSSGAGDLQFDNGGLVEECDIQPLPHITERFGFWLWSGRVEVTEPGERYNVKLIGAWRRPTQGEMVRLISGQPVLEADVYALSSNELHTVSAVAELPSSERLAENERCAQRCENMIAHQHHYDPDGTLSKAELLQKVTDLIRSGEYGPLDMAVLRDRKPLPALPEIS